MRVFVLGDSYSDNLFEKSLQNGTSFEIKKFVLSINNETSEPARWWTDWLNLWGFEIHNYAVGGSTIESLLYQFGKIGEYREGDRIILNLTHPSRFNWYEEDGRGKFFHSWGEGIEDKKIKMLFQQQAINREKSFKEGYLKNELVPFLNHLINKHPEYKPILWSTFWESIEEIKDFKYFFDIAKIMNIRKDHDVRIAYENNKVWKPTLQIDQESNNYALDGHFGRYGNYELAILFKDVLESGIDGFYLKDDRLFETLEKTVMSNDKKFDIPRSWIRTKII